MLFHPTTVKFRQSKGDEVRISGLLLPYRHLPILAILVLLCGAAAAGYAYTKINRYRKVAAQHDELLSQLALANDPKALRERLERLHRELEEAVRDGAPSIAGLPLDDPKRVKWDDYRYRLAADYYRQNRLDESARLADALLTDRPKEARALALRGLIHLRANQPEPAARRLEAAQAADAGGAQDVSLPLAQCRLKLKDPEGALKLLDACLAREPDSVPALRARVDTLVALERWEPAADDAARLARLTGLPPDALTAAVIEIKARRLDAAERRLQSLIDLDRQGFLATLARATNNLAWACFEKGEPDKALAYARRAVAMIPEEAVANDTLGLILDRTGHSAEALPYLEKAVQAAPDVADYREHRDKARANAGAKP